MSIFFSGTIGLSNKELSHESPMQIPHSNDFKIKKDVLEKVNNIYEETTNEFSACLDVAQNVEYAEDGSSISVSYEITGIYDIVLSDGENYANHDYCEYAVIHSHPNHECFFSLTDIYSIKKRFKKGEFFSVVICNKNELIYITRNNYEEKKIII